MSDPGTPPPYIPPVANADDPSQAQRPVPIHLFPLPPAILAAMVITGVVFAFALVRLPNSIKSGVQYEKAQTLMAAGKNQEAADLLKPVYNKFPQSNEVKLDLALSYAKSSQYAEAAEILMTFEGVKVTKEEDQKLTAIESYFPQDPTPANKEGEKQ